VALKLRQDVEAQSASAAGGREGKAGRVTHLLEPLQRALERNLALAAVTAVALLRPSVWSGLVYR
jgi:hypothetical protein